ncbi:MAG: hypothetical protein ACRCXZ_10200, partial [Patescibacteria group bacterium]
ALGVAVAAVASIPNYGNIQDMSKARGALDALQAGTRDAQSQVDATKRNADRTEKDLANLTRTQAEDGKPVSAETSRVLSKIQETRDQVTAKEAKVKEGLKAEYLALQEEIHQVQQSMPGKPVSTPMASGPDDDPGQFLAGFNKAQEDARRDMADAGGTEGAAMFTPENIAKSRAMNKASEKVSQLQDQATEVEMKIGDSSERLKKVAEGPADESLPSQVRRMGIKDPDVVSTVDKIDRLTKEKYANQDIVKSAEVKAMNSKSEEEWRGPEYQAQIDQKQTQTIGFGAGAAALGTAAGLLDAKRRKKNSDKGEASDGSDSSTESGTAESIVNSEAELDPSAFTQSNPASEQAITAETKNSNLTAKAKEFMNSGKKGGVRDRIKSLGSKITKEAANRAGATLLTAGVATGTIAAGVVAENQFNVTGRMKDALNGSGPKVTEVQQAKDQVAPTRPDRVAPPVEQVSTPKISEVDKYQSELEEIRMRISLIQADVKSGITNISKVSSEIERLTNRASTLQVLIDTQKTRKSETGVESPTIMAARSEASSAQKALDQFKVSSEGKSVYNRLNQLLGKDPDSSDAMSTSLSQNKNLIPGLINSGVSQLAIDQALANETWVVESEDEARTLSKISAYEATKDWKKDKK